MAQHTDEVSEVTPGGPVVTVAGQPMTGQTDEVSTLTQIPLAPRRRRRYVVQLLLALAWMVCGAAGAVGVLHYVSGAQPGPVPSVPTPLPSEPSAGVTTPVTGEVTLTPEAQERAGIKTAEVTVVDPSVTTQVPGSVMADAYHEVKIVPIVGGIVTKVHVALGTSVQRGAPLATIFSAELAEAQTKFLTMQATFAADHQKFQRTQQLVQIGAVSQQELEEVTALHDSHTTEVEAAQQRLMQLGLTPAHVKALGTSQQIRSEVLVPAPMTGIITSRTANLGQVVGMGQELFVVTDLSQVWVVGDLYEQDFQKVRVGSHAVLTTPAYPALALYGRVTYIDPRVDPQTRTAKVRVEVPNRAAQLRLGMFMTMTFTTPSGTRLAMVPRTAIQLLGDHHVVFVPVPGEEGKFIARPVQVGSPQGDGMSILQGLQPGEVVVTEGSFLLRAEMVRNAPTAF